MNNDRVATGIIGALIGGVAVWLYLTSSWGPATFNMMQRGGDPRGGMMSQGQLDAHFIEQMIPHHEDAITMANLALERATHPEIKQLAQAIIDSQSREIEQMTTWYANWFGRELPTGTEVMQHHGMMSGGGMHMGMMGTSMDLDRLEQAADFDRAFIEHMIPHHQMAVMMASMLERGTTHPEMQRLADDIITAQTREIDQMREWYAAWF